MAWGQGHLVQVERVPRGQHDAAVLGRAPDGRDARLQLVDPLARVVRVGAGILCAKVSPLEAIHGAEIPLTVARQPTAIEELPGPIPIPDMYVLGGE